MLEGKPQGKGGVLGRVTQLTGCHRKAAIRLLNREARPVSGQGRGRARTYGLEMAAAMEVMWEAGNHLCRKRLQPFLPEMVGSLYCLRPANTFVLAGRIGYLVP